MSDLISRCELFNRLATIPAPPEANDFKAEIYLAVVLEVVLLESSRIGYDRGYDKGGGMDESNRENLVRAN